MATFDEFYTSLSADSNVRGDEFEKIFVPWFLKTDPTWSNQIEGIWLWDDYPKRSQWGEDNGVDIVLHHANGQRWAVQAKCFSPNNYLSKNELNSFIAESSDNRFQEKLLISSTNRIGPNADKLLKRHKVIRILLTDLRNSDLIYPSSIKKLYEGRPIKKYKPQPHQKDAISDVIKGLHSANKGQVLMACGSGKTLTALWIKESLLSKNTLVLLPSLSLLRQTVKNWNTHQTKNFKWLCVCSDKSVAKNKKNKDQWIMNSSELDISVTSEVNKIIEFLSLSGEKVIFSTYQSSDLVCDAQQITKSLFDLTIADEAHNCTGRVETYFGNILDDTKIRTKKKLFFTATPKILSKRIKKASLEREIEVASMDDISKFGDVLHKLDFSEAIKKGILSDYQVSIVGVDNAEISKMIRIRELISTYKDYIFDSESLGTFIAVVKSIRNYNLRKLISFHNLIENANIFSQIFPLIPQFFHNDSDDNLTFNSDYVEGKMTATEKDEKIQKLNSLDKDQCFVLSNARCLSEGVDVPTLDGVAFIDPKHSPIDIVQAVGRAIRKADGKQKGTIIVPVFLDDMDNLDEKMLASKFSTVWSVIVALKSQDDQLLEKIDNLRVQLGSKRIIKITKKGLEKIHFDLPENLNPDFYDSLYTRLVENTSDDWFGKFGELKDFKEKYGHASPNSKKFHIGRWCLIQRRNYRDEKISKERIELLESIGFIWDPSEDDWQNMFEELKDFKEKNGHASPHTKQSALGRWCLTQRKNYKNNNLSRERIDLLESIDFIWDLDQDYWQIMFEELKEFKEKNGHASPHTKQSALGRWCMTQRRNYKKNSLSIERIDLLESIGFIWDLDQDYWQIMFEELKEFKEKNGHVSPNVNTPGLGRWCMSQRKNYKNNNLSRERIDLLESLGFIWDPFENEWYKNFAELKEFKEKNGHASPLTKSMIGQWCSDQRVLYKKGKLPQERIDLLESIGFIWDPFENEWQEKFKELIEFKEKNGHTSPNTESNELGKWCSRQRSSYNKGNLSQERIDLLESVGFIWDPSEYEWQEKFRELKDFKEKNGHVSPPTRNSPLGKWCSRQRRSYNKGKLSQERIDLLESVGFIWDPLDFEWQEKFKELIEFKEKNGHVSPNVNRPGLGQWCSDQRKFYKNKKLSQERIELLESIGFIWDQLDFEWQEKFRELKEFKEKNGHASPNVNNSSLGRWCCKQREINRKGKLPQERIDLLESVGFIWDPLDFEWQKMFKELKEFKEKNGHASPATSNSILGQWCLAQRKNYKNKKLPQERIELLESIGFIWDPFENEWQEKFKELIEFKNKNGHTTPLTKSTLGRWCQTQRSNYKKRKLSQERIDLLESIGFIWDPLDFEWQKMFKKLKDFKEKNGHASPPTKNSILGEWCLTQKKNYKNQKLSKERIDLLESVGFIWFLK